MTGRGKKLLGPDELMAAAEVLAGLAEKAHADVALIGGFALQMYGSPRLTADLDVAALKRIRGLPGGKQLSFGGEQTHVEAVVRSKRVRVPTDVIVRIDAYAPLYEDAIATAVSMRESPLPVATPEHLAAMKMASGRARDALDFEFLATTPRLLRRQEGAQDHPQAPRTLRRGRVREARRRGALEGFS